MSIDITNPGVAGITVESDPTALKLTGGTLSGELNTPEIGNILNTNLVIDSYNDTGAGTHYYHTFTPFDGKFVLAPNGNGISQNKGGFEATFGSTGIYFGNLGYMLSSEEGCLMSNYDAYDGTNTLSVTATGITFPGGSTQTTAGLPLTGGTLSGKIVTTATVSTAPLNIAVCATIPTTTVAGDVYVHSGNIFFKDSSNTQRACLVNNGVNAIDVSAIVAALRVTQRGTGNAIEVEDSTSPDSTKFVVDQFGKVGIGVVPDATAALTIDANGIKFWTGSVVQYISTPISATGTYDKEMPIQINGVNYRIPCRQI